MRLISSPHSERQTADDALVTNWSVVALMLGIGAAGLGGIVAMIAWWCTTMAAQPHVESPAVVQSAPPRRPATALTRRLAPPKVQPVLQVAPEPAQPELQPAATSVKAAPASVALPQPKRPIASAAAKVATVRDAPALEQPAPLPRRGHLPEYELHTLAKQQAKEVDLETEKGTTRKILEESRQDAVVPPGKISVRDGHVVLAPLRSLLSTRIDLQGLPLRFESDCQTSKEGAANLTRLSRDFRCQLAVLDGPTSRSTGSMYASAQATDALLARLRNIKDAGERRDAVAVLVQIFQAEDEPLRLGMSRLLAAISGPEASAALARRALFDFSPNVRESALDALRGRPPAEYRPVLLQGLRYVWPPVADHAADALVALGDRGALPDLLAMLAAPDPAAPERDHKGRWVVPEMARVNHLRNCLLCHSASLDRHDPVRGLVPTPGQPLAEVYYESQKGDFVRADITYLRQDFSVKQLVENSKPWPEQQRFDFLVRRRPLTPAEVHQRGLQGGKPQKDAFASYPQRDAVLYALRGLATQQAGILAVAWQRFFRQDNTPAQQ